MKVVISFETDIPQLGLDLIRNLPEDERTEIVLRYLLNMKQKYNEVELYSSRKMIQIDGEWV